MNIKDELIKYAKWYDKATMPEYAQTDEADLVQNVESYLQTEGKNIVLSDVMAMLPTAMINRVEVIDEKGRSYVNWKPTNRTELQVQDNGRTLKVFVSQGN